MEKIRNVTINVSDMSQAGMLVCWYVCTCCGHNPSNDMKYSPQCVYLTQALIRRPCSVYHTLDYCLILTFP